jgi:DNA-binding NarL/FixJ family response regulator
MCSLAGCHVLLMEDNALVAMDVEASLRDFGCEVIGPFDSAAGAIAAVKTEKPQVAVLDINLNGHPSFELADALALAEVPFVFLSGHSRLFLPTRHRERPFVAKPYLARILRAALAELCER